MLRVSLQHILKPVLLFPVFCCLAVGSIQAQQSLTTEQLINMLQNSAPAPNGDKGQTLTTEELMQMQENSLSIIDRDTRRDLQLQPAKPATKGTHATQKSPIEKPVQPARPSVDLEILFEYNSDQLSPQAYPVLINLGQALTDKRLSGSVFMIAGHTDAKGGSAYNQELSMRRAQAVKDFLSQSFSIPPQTLVAIGYGEQQLKNPFDPNSGENRRVQIVNLR